MSKESRILVLQGRYHLGDNSGLFQDAPYIGCRLSLPVSIRWTDPAAESVSFVFYTHDLETWGEWLGHKVTINGTEIGRLKDPNDTHGREEEFVLTVSKKELEKILDGANRFLLDVELERQPAHPGFADDFVLLRIDTVNIVIGVGWTV